MDLCTAMALCCGWNSLFLLSGRTARLRYVLRNSAATDWGKIMRKRLVTSEPSASEQAWLDLVTAATLELTSEDETHPIEAALSSRDRQGWRASGPGTQTIQLIFDRPQRLRRINLVFKIRSPLALRRRPRLSRNCAAAMELQSPANCMRN